jgi:hypothetical protein
MILVYFHVVCTLPNCISPLTSVSFQDVGFTLFLTCLTTCLSTAYPVIVTILTPTKLKQTLANEDRFTIPMYAIQPPPLGHHLGMPNTNFGAGAFVHVYNCHVLLFEHMCQCIRGRGGVGLDMLLTICLSQSNSQAISYIYVWPQDMIICG